MPLISDDTWNLRQQVLQKYGGTCTCLCGCRDANLRHLQMDHALGGGSSERLTIRGKNAYIKLMAEARNPTLNPLCANCHFEKTMFGTCTNRGFSPTAPRAAASSDTGDHDVLETPRQGVGVIEQMAPPPGKFDYADWHTWPAPPPAPAQPPSPKRGRLRRFLAWRV